MNIDEYGRISYADIHQRSELICEEAIKYIHDPSAYILRLALKKNPYLIRYVQESNDGIWLDGIRKNLSAIKFLKSRNVKLIIYAIRQNPTAIKYFDEQPDHLCRLAISLDYEAITLVK